MLPTIGSLIPMSFNMHARFKYINRYHQQHADHAEGAKEFVSLHSLP